MQIIKDNLYQVTYHIYFCSPEKMKKELHGHAIDEFDPDICDGLHLHVSSKTETNVHIIWINSMLPNKRKLTTLIHELSHAIITVWEVHGLNMTQDQEAYCYYFTYIFDQIKLGGK